MGSPHDLTHPPVCRLCLLCSQPKWLHKGMGVVLSSWGGAVLQSAARLGELSDTDSAAASEESSVEGVQCDDPLWDQQGTLLKLRS